MPTPSIPTLYHIKWYPSSIPLQLLHELSIPPTSYAVHQLTQQQLHTSPELQSITPRKVVPVTAFPDGTSLLESGAIAMHILESFDKQATLHPRTPGPRRRKFLQGMFYAAGEAFHALGSLIALCHEVKEQDRDARKLEEAKDKFESVVVEHLKTQVQGDGFYLGEFSAVDVLFSFVFVCFEYCKVGGIGDEGVREYVGRLKERESFATVYSSELESC